MYSSQVGRKIRTVMPNGSNGIILSDRLDIFFQMMSHHS
jgi:hypothetical protein